MAVRSRSVSAVFGFVVSLFAGVAFAAAPSGDSAANRTDRASTRPTSTARRVVGLPFPQLGEPAAQWTEVEDASIPSLRQRTGARVFRVTSWADVHGLSSWVMVRGETEYFLPGAINSFLADAGIPADGSQQAEVAAVLVQSLLPGQALADIHATPIDLVGPDGERCTLRVTARDVSGEHEWEIAYGAGERAGHVRLVRIFEGSGAARRQVSIVAPVSVLARSVTIGGNRDSAPAGEYILRIAYNGVGTNNTLVLTFDGFLSGGTPDALYMRAMSTVAGYGPEFLPVTAVPIDGTGHGVYNWTPAGGALTGVCLLQLGAVTNPADPANTFVPNAAWSTLNLVFDKVRGIKFSTGADSCLVHYCDQFFQGHPPATAGAESFVDYIVSGLNDSWNKQVVDWSMAQGHPGNIPVDADHVHHLYVVNPAQIYHGDNAAGSRAWGSGSNREYWIRLNHFYIDPDGTPYPTPLYSNEDIRTRGAVFHEFFHGVQSGWIDGILDGTGNWMTEGQARFMPTVQYEAEEFLENTQHLFPRDANAFLGGDYRWFFGYQEYSGCLFWRFLYERHHPGAAVSAKLATIRGVLQQVRGRFVPTDWLYPNVVTAALAADPGSFADFFAVQDSFAHTAWRHDWSPDSPSILRPTVAGAAAGSRVSATWAGPAVTVNDGIGFRHAMDFWNFRLDPAAKLRLMNLSFNADPERNASMGSYHLTVMLYKGLSNTQRVAVLPRALASWDSTFEVKDIDSVAVSVVRVDTTAVLPDSTYTLTLSPPLAVDAPAYDHVQNVLDELGPRYRYATIDEATLHNASFPWGRYDVIFLNCSGAAAAEAPLARDSLKAFVQRGGYLYVSDYDYEYIKQAWPDAIRFNTPTKVGIQGPVTATITDPGLAAVFGSPTVGVDYDLSAWVSVDAPGPGTAVHLVGTYEYDPNPPPGSLVANGSGGHGPGGPHAAPLAAASLAAVSAGFPTRTGPLLLSFADGKGRVIFTTFHNAYQTTAQRQKLIKYMIFKQVAGDLLQQALDALTVGYHTYMTLTNGIAQGQTQAYHFDNPYSTNIDAVLNWGGSDLQLTLRRPNGSVAGTIHGPAHPAVIHVAAAEAGDWTLEVQALDVPDSNYAFALVVGGAAAIPGMPALPAAAEARLCAGGTAQVAVPVRNLANYRDTFHVTVSSGAGWSVAPSDTMIEAWEGMADSLRVRVTPPPGTPASTLETLHTTMTSVTTPSLSAAGTRTLRVTAEPPTLTHSPTTAACPGTSVFAGWAVLRSTSCPIRFVARARSPHGWTVTPDSVVVDLTTDYYASASFFVSVPPGTADGTIDLLKLVVNNELYPALRDSLVDTLIVRSGPPEAMAPPPLQSLRSLDLQFTCGVYNPAACPKLMSIALGDSLGWPLNPTSFTGPVFPGVNSISVTLRVPATAPYGQVDRVRVIARVLDGSLPPDTAVTYVTVTTPAQVLLVDQGGGLYGQYCAAALDGLAITHTDWYTSYTAPDDTVLTMFQKVLWIGGVSYGLAGADTTHLGTFLRGGGRMLISAQDFLLDASEAAPFASAYFGTNQATEGGGSFAVQGRSGTFLGAVGPVWIAGADGAGNQFSTDELSTSGSAFAIMDYVPNAAATAPTSPAPQWLIAPPQAPGPKPTRAHAASAGSSTLTTGIAAVANDPGRWRTVFMGFGIEALADSLLRRTVLAGVLHFFDYGTTDAPRALPGDLALAEHPNPSSSSVAFIVTMPRPGPLRLALYDLSGRRLRVLHDGEAAAGEQSHVWDGRDAAGAVASGGIYFARLEAQGRTLTTKLVWLGR